MGDERDGGMPENAVAAERNDDMPQDMDASFRVRVDIKDLMGLPENVQDAQFRLMVAECASRCCSRTLELTNEKMKKPFARVPHGKRCNRLIKRAVEIALPGLSEKIRKDERSMANVSRISGEWNNKILREGLSSMSDAVVCLAGFLHHIKRSIFTTVPTTDAFTRSVLVYLSKLLSLIDFVVVYFLTGFRLFYGIPFEENC